MKKFTKRAIIGKYRAKTQRYKRRMCVGQEIERKFLVREGLWHPKGQGLRVRQGYLPQKGELLVRIRTQDDRAFLTLKGRTISITRAEFEYEIPAADADALLPFCQAPLIEKVRYLEPAGAHRFEIDCFFGENEGLIVAEIELSHEDEAFIRPDWLGAEVSGDSRYYNANLVAHPYRAWGKG